MATEFPKKLEELIKAYGFEAEPKQKPPIRFEDLTREDLIEINKELRLKVDAYQYELDQELRAKLKQARMLSVLEMHLDCLPWLSEGHHQIVSLEHAVAWIARYGPDNADGLLVDVNQIQRNITTKRIRDIMHKAQECDTRPACKHVLQARPNTLHRGELLTFDQISRGLPLQHFLETIDEEITEDSQLWKRLDGTLEYCAKNDERLSKGELKYKSFLSLYFYAQTSPAFLHIRNAYLSNLQREGHNKKNAKACPKVPQSGLRRTIVKMKKRFGDEDLETISPTKSALSGMAVMPRFGAGIPRPKRQSMVKLYEKRESAAIPLMSGAMQSSRVLSSAALSVDRDRRERSRSRSRSREPKDRARQSRDPQHGTPRMKRIRESDTLASPSGHKLQRRDTPQLDQLQRSAQPPQLQRRERVRRDGHRSTRETEAGPSSSSRRTRDPEARSSSASRRTREPEAKPSSSSQVKRTPSHKSAVSAVSDASRRTPVSPIVPGEQGSPHSFAERKRRERAPKTPEIPARTSSTRSAASSKQLDTGLKSSSPRSTHSGGSQHRSKTPGTPGTTPAPEAAVPPRGGPGPSNLSSVQSYWPGPNEPTPSELKEERRKEKEKAKAKEEPPLSPLRSNPFISTGAAAADLPDAWKPPPSAASTAWPAIPSTLTPAPVYPPPPPSSIYSVYPKAPEPLQPLKAPPPPGSHLSAVPPPLRVHRDREGRERIYDEEEPSPKSKPKPKPQQPEPKTPPGKQTRPISEAKSSPAASIPPGVDLTNVAGGLGHGLLHVRGRDSSSTLASGHPIVPEGVDLDTAAGATQRYIPARQAWDKTLNPKSIGDAIREQMRDPDSPQRTVYTETTIKSKSSKDSRRGQKKSTRERSPPLPPSLLEGSEGGVSGSGTSQVKIPDPPNPSVLGLDDPDQWSSQIGLPPSPGSTLPSSKANKAFNLNSPTRGRLRRRRSFETIQEDQPPPPEAPEPPDSSYYHPDDTPTTPTIISPALQGPAPDPEPTTAPVSEKEKEKEKAKSPQRTTRFREHIDSIIGSEYNPVTNPEPSKTTTSSRSQDKPPPQPQPQRSGIPRASGTTTTAAQPRKSGGGRKSPLFGGLDDRLDRGKSSSKIPHSSSRTADKDKDKDKDKSKSRTKDKGKEKEKEKEKTKEKETRKSGRTSPLFGRLDDRRERERGNSSRRTEDPVDKELRERRERRRKERDEREKEREDRQKAEQERKLKHASRATKATDDSGFFSEAVRKVKKGEW